MDNKNITQNMMSGFAKPIPLISFYSIIDEDMALIKYIILEDRNYDLYDLDKVTNMKYLDIVGELYRRKYYNPIKFLSRNGVDIDSIYKDLVNNKEADILKHAITTEMYNVMLEFDKSGEIIPAILYYSQAQLDLLESIDEISNLRKISIDYFKRSLPNEFTQYYFKYISESNDFLSMHDKTFYFSTCGLNLVDDNDDILIDYNLARTLAANRNNINVFDMYRMDLIGKYNKITENDE